MKTEKKNKKNNSHTYIMAQAYGEENKNNKSTTRQIPSGWWLEKTGEKNRNKTLDKDTLVSTLKHIP